MHENGSLMEAAKLAGSLSESRRKRIRLILGASGLLIEGRLFDQHGEREIYQADYAVSWPQIYDGSPLKRIVRQIDSKLLTAWRQSELNIPD